MLVSACMEVEFLWVMGLAKTRYTGTVSIITMVGNLQLCVMFVLQLMAYERNERTLNFNNNLPINFCKVC